MRPYNLKQETASNTGFSDQPSFLKTSVSACAKILVDGVKRSNIHRMAVTTLVGGMFLGCASVPGSSPTGTIAQGAFVQTLSHDGEEREFIVYVPSSYDGNEELPLMFAFHGFGGTAEDFMNWTQMHPLAEQENFILVFPQGSLLDGSPHWNSSLPGGDNKSSADDFGFFDAMVEEISTTYRIDMDRIYTSGYSNGSFFSYALACYRSDLVAAVASVSGTMMDGLIDDCNPSHPTAMINLHGTSDYVVPYNGGVGYSSVDEVMEYWMDINNTDSSPLTSTTGNIEQYLYSNGEGDIGIAHYKINGGDHVWFDLDYEGRSTSGIIWDFVSQYNKNGLIGSAE